MIARSSLLVCAFAFYCSALRAAEDDPEVFIYSVHLDKQTDLVWAIKRSRLLGIAPWKGAEEAPLSPHKAVAVANKYVQEHLGGKGASILRITMLPIGKGSDYRWAYDIDYSTDPPLFSEDPLLHVMVAMDAKVVVPEKRSPRKFK
jgi:hypothetical protein